MSDGARITAAAAHQGLTETEAQDRLGHDGPNDLPAPRPPGVAVRAARQVADPMSLLLLAAGLVTLAGLRQVPEGAAILAILLVNVVIGVTEETRAERAVTALRAMTAPEATVRRDGSARRIPAADLVEGDLVEIGAGDRIPADARLLITTALAVDESALTGEAFPADKRAGGATGGDVALGDRTGEVLSGTYVVRGAGLAQVCRTGERTEIGRVAAGLGTRGRAPLERELVRVSTRIGLIAIAAGLLVVAAGAGRVLRGEIGIWDICLVAVALAIAAVPESLVTAVTTALALGARRMARLGVIVRQLAAIEGLGATTVIASDKTGTLTTDRLTVAQVVAVPGRDRDLWIAAARANDAHDGVGDPIDVALLDAATRAGVQPDIVGVRVASQPFSAETRRMSAVHVTQAGRLLTMKGAPEVVLGTCERGPATELLRIRSRELASDGLRVIAFGDAPADGAPGAAMGAGERLRPLGVLGLRDDIREAAADAVAACRSAGMRVVMVTGDHIGTARAVADAVGIPPEPALTADDLVGEDGASRARRLRDATVVARVDPQTKLDLVRAHQSGGEIVTMTGDGVNDAPALRAADVGVAVAGAGGTDVARQAATVVVTTGDLGTIVTGVREGRRLYHNIASMIGYLLTGNLGEIIIVFAGMLAWPGLVVPLLPVQLLWINLIMDGIPALAIGADRPSGDALRDPPRRAGDGLLTWARLPRMLVRAVLTAGLVLGAAQLTFALGGDDALVRAQLVVTLVAVRLALAYVVRARRSTFERGWWRSAPVRYAVAGTAALQILVTSVPPLGAPLGLVPLPATGWAMAAAAFLLTPLISDLIRYAPFVGDGIHLHRGRGATP